MLIKELISAGYKNPDGKIKIGLEEKQIVACDGIMPEPYLHSG